MLMNVAWCQCHNPGESWAFAYRAILRAAITSGTGGRGVACLLPEHQGEYQVTLYRRPASPNSSLGKQGIPYTGSWQCWLKQFMHLLGEKKTTLPFKRQGQGNSQVSMLEKSFRNKLNTTEGFVSNYILLLPTETKSLEKVIYEIQGY